MPAQRNALVGTSPPRKRCNKSAIPEILASQITHVLSVDNSSAIRPQQPVANKSTAYRRH